VILRFFAAQVPARFSGSGVQRLRHLGSGWNLYVGTRLPASGEILPPC